MSVQRASLQARINGLKEYQKTLSKRLAETEQDILKLEQELSVLPALEPAE